MCSQGMGWPGEQSDRAGRGSSEEEEEEEGGRAPGQQKCLSCTLQGAGLEQDMQIPPSAPGSDKPLLPTQAQGKTAAGGRGAECEHERVLGRIWGLSPPWMHLQGADLTWSLSGDTKLPLDGAWLLLMLSESLESQDWLS